MGIQEDRSQEQDIEAVWSIEIERRLVEIDEGTVELIPWEEVRAELFRSARMRSEFSAANAERATSSIQVTCRCADNAAELLTLPW